MKKVYEKPELNAKAYAQFENVFTACDKGNASPQGCESNTYATEHSGPRWSAHFADSYTS
ncbi:MAG: hypothetical protein ABRQ26_06705 [Syntrophomonadaceae bacterium]